MRVEAAVASDDTSPRGAGLPSTVIADHPRHHAAHLGLAVSALG